MKNFLLFNQSFGMVGSPNQTDETQTRENRIGLMSYLRRTLMLLLVAYIGIGQMWAASDIKQYARIYFDNSKANWNYNYVYLCANDEQIYQMSPIANTKLYWHFRTDGDWNSCPFVRIIATSASWSTPGGWTNIRDNAENATNTYNDFNYNKDTYNVIQAQKTGSKSDLSPITVTYLGNTSAWNLNKTITIRAKVMAVNANSYADANTPGALSATSYKFTTDGECNYGTTGSLSAGSSSTNFEAGYTATTTLTATAVANYQFMGWYDADGNRLTTNTTATVYPTMTTTYYAYYAAMPTATLTLPNNGGSMPIGKTNYTPYYLYNTQSANQDTLLMSPYAMIAQTTTAPSWITKGSKGTGSNEVAASGLFKGNATGTYLSNNKCTYYKLGTYRILARVTNCTEVRIYGSSGSDDSKLKLSVYEISSNTAGAVPAFDPVEGAKNGFAVLTKSGLTASKEYLIEVTGTANKDNIVNEIALFSPASSSCSTPAAPTISGTTAYTYGGTITLEASHTGSNHDASTTYRWLKGGEFGSAVEVQAAATGSSGYTFTKTAAIADAGTYWCEASNGAGCTNHNSSGYAITVAKADISPSLSYDATTLTVGGTSSNPTITGNTGSGAVSYAVTASSPSGSVTVHSSTGVVTAVHAGTATITATIAASTNYNGGTATANFTINKGTISPTLSYASTSLAVGDVTATPTVGGNTGSGSVTYAVTSATPAGCITVDSETGVVTAVAEGTGTVTATIAATADYLGNTATEDFTVSACSPTVIAGIEANSYNTGKNHTGTLKGSYTVSLQNSTAKTHDGKSGYKIADGNYISLTLKSGEYFQDGDKAKVYITYKGDLDGKDLRIYKGTSSAGALVGSLAAGSVQLGWNEVTIDVPDNTTSSLTVHRGSGDTEQNHYVYAFKVERPCGDTYAITEGSHTNGSIAITDGSSAITEAEEGATVHISATPNTGYNFTSWSVTKTASGDAISITGTNPATFTMPAEAVTVAATFTATNYTIAYDLADGSVASPNPTSYTIESEAITLNNPTKTGYTFAGWTGTGLAEATTTVTIAAGSTGNRSYTATWTPVAATHTVTYNAQGGSVTPTSETVSTATLPTPTKSGYTFDGWYTSGGSKITGTYNPTADITLYAQWQSTDCDAGGTTTLVDINFKDASWSGKTFSQANDNNEDLINGVYFWSKDASKHFSLADNTSNGLTFPNNNMSSGTYYFCIPITGINSSNKQITVTLKHGYSSAQAEYKWAYVDGRTSFSDGNTGGSGGTKVQDASKASTEMTFTKGSLSNTSGHLFIGRSSSSYPNIYGVTVTTPGAAGTCYYVTYNGNGATGGYTTDEAAYASGDNATAATNSFTKTGYTFKEWRTNANGTGTKYEAGDPIAISGNITLYAIWQAAGYTLAWNTNGGSALAGDYSSGSFADGATITAPNDPTRANYTFDSWNTAGDGTGNAYTGTMPAANTTYYAVWKNTLTLKTGSQGSESDKSPTVFLDGSSLNGFSAHKAAGYTLQGYYTAATGGTKVLNADGSFAASNIARFVTSGKWSRTTGDTILVAQWESSYLLKWNLQLNKAEDAISTTSKESATARITTASMTNLTNNGGLTITGSKKSNLTSKIETPINLTVAESKYMSVSFDVTAGYQLLPSAVKVMVQPVGDGENKYAKLILEDENSHSINTVVECEGTEKGKKTTVTLSNAGGTVFTGTVTLKILVYNASGASTTNNCYRLGSPIQIDGAIEAACELPSYEGMEYDQTEYTVGGDEASAIRVTGGSADTYRWKWNSTNDRSTGTEVGTNDASYTPLTTISEVGTRYYWCELTNDDCDGVVKTPAVAITVRANKSEASVTWTDPANEPNYGGGGYVIRATMNSGYDGELSAEDLTAPAGIRITNVSIDNEADQKYIEATFDVTTAFNRDENSKISFTLSHDATTGYDAISDEHDVDYDACSGGEEGSAAIALTSAIHDEGSGNAPRYWFETSGVGRVFGLNYGKATLGTSSDATFSTEGYSYVASSTSQRWVFQPYVEGVTKIRIYIKSATNTLRVLSIGKNASWQDQSSKYSNIAVDTIIYSNDKTTGLDNNQKGYAEIQFSSALTKNNYYMITMSSTSTYIYGVTLYSGSVGDGGNLATSLTFANTGPIAADASTANFQNIASKSGENRNTLGTITYSSNNDAATVNATTGEVSIHAKGTAQAVTITATLSASGCYQGATATYTINVAADVCDEPSGSIELTTGSATKCSSESVILTMTGFTSGATVEWYNGDTKVNGTSGYTIVTSGSTSTLTTSNDGTYSAIAKVAGGCASGAGRTNSITISDISVDASATKIVDKWYVKNGRLTPDIALWQLGEGATLDEVTIERNVSGEGTLGLTSSDFVARDGIVYLSGKEPSANDTGADIEYTLTLTVKDACDDPHEMTEKTITLTHQKNTDKHVLAFVVNGTAKGGFTEGITAPQTTGVSLYNTIAAQFDVQATNIYATDDEKKLKEYYSQYDILCITDYPNTQTKGANSKSYVDAIGSLIDIRPILTMEAFVSKLENWKVKGISGNPKSPSTRQYTMLLQCKDHEIFAQTKLTTIGEGDETMYRVSMVDSTKEDYATLDATYGAILPHKEKESKKGAGDAEYNYGGKPALQGFTFTQEMSDNDLLPIGLIDDGAGNDLQVGIERQHNMEARLMVLGINSYAMERLTNDGERVVINALNYLMKKNAEDIADCSTSFVGGAEGEETNWNNADNWTGNTVPDKTQKVRILAPCVVPAGVKAHVAGVLIAPNGKYNREANSAEGSLTIAAGGALIVDGKIQAVTAPAYNRPRATAPADLTIGSTEKNGNGTLIFDNEDGSTQAIVEYYSKATTDEASSWSWQYMAVPFNDNSSAYRNYYDSYLYRWKEDCSGWEIVPNRGEVYPWVGYTITQVGAKTYVMDGTLVETGEMEFTVPEGKNLVLGNSWTAPIQVKQFTDDDFVNMSKNVYLFNTGYDPDGEGSFSGARYEGGTYVTIPIHSSPYTGDSLISSLQAFIVYAKTGEGGGTFTLDYDRHVRPARYSDNLNAGPMHAPKRGGAINDKPAVLKVWASGSRYDDRLVVLEREDFSTGLDEGWDGNKRVAGNSSPLIFAVTDNGREAVSAIPTMEGTLIGFWAGEDNEYTLHFEYNEEDELYLLDLDNNTYTPVNSNSTYVFTVPDKKAHNRFILTRIAPDPVATGVEETQASEKPEAKAIKFLKDEKVFIFVNGKLYDATGKVVK